MPKYLDSQGVGYLWTKLWNKYASLVGAFPTGTTVKDYIDSQNGSVPEGYTNTIEYVLKSDETLQNNIDKTNERLDTLVNENANDVIDSFNEVKKFLEAYKQSDSLQGVLQTYADGRIGDLGEAADNETAYDGKRTVKDYIDAQDKAYDKKANDTLALQSITYQDSTVTNDTTKAYTAGSISFIYATGTDKTNNITFNAISVTDLDNILV